MTSTSEIVALQELADVVFPRLDNNLKKLFEYCGLRVGLDGIKRNMDVVGTVTFEELLEKLHLPPDFDKEERAGHQVVLRSVLHCLEGIPQMQRISASSIAHAIDRPPQQVTKALHRLCKPVKKWDPNVAPLSYLGRGKGWRKNPKFNFEVQN